MIRSMQLVDKDNCLPCGTGDAREKARIAGELNSERNNRGISSPQQITASTYDLGRSIAKGPQQHDL